MDNIDVDTMYPYTLADIERVAPHEIGAGDLIAAAGPLEVGRRFQGDRVFWAPGHRQPGYSTYPIGFRSTNYGYESTLQQPETIRVGRIKDSSRRDRQAVAR